MQTAVAFYKNIAFSATDQWAWYTIRMTGYDFQSQAGKDATLQLFAMGIGNLMNGRRTPIRFKLISYGRAFDFKTWVEGAAIQGERFGYSQAYFDRISQIADTIHADPQGFQDSVLHFGVHLGARNTVDTSGSNAVLSGWKTFKGKIDGVIRGALTTAGGQRVSEVECRNAEEAERYFYETLGNGALSVERTPTVELMMMEKHRFYSGMTLPQGRDLRYVRDHAEYRSILAETVSEVEGQEFPGYMRFRRTIEGVESEGYAAALSISEYPDVGDYPEARPVFDIPRQFNATLYVVGELIDASEVKSMIKSKRKEVRGQVASYVGHRDELDEELNDLPEEIERMQTYIERVKTELGKDNLPWVRASYRILLESNDVETLRANISNLRQAMTDNLGVRCAVPHGDQAKLLNELSPASSKQIKDYDLETNLYMLGAVGIHLGSEVGDTRISTHHVNT